ncbi:MAG TPA: hypothetical protein VG916_14415 [Gemmatimonadaceae bacterium]|nr:hypothetical protein [Gemmatimonadaceae bacterium]
MRTASAMIVLVSCATALAPEGTAAAQDYAPELTATLTAGGTMIDNAYSGGLSVGIQRTWGFVVGGLYGDILISSLALRGTSVYVDPTTGKAYCGSSRTTTPTESGECPGFSDMTGGASGELGVALGPARTLALSAGYRLGPAEEPFLAAAWYPSGWRRGLRWAMRGALGRKVRQIHVGVAIDLDAIRP